MKVSVLYFSQLRVAIGGIGAEEIDVPAGATLADLTDAVMELHPAARAFLPSLLVSRNQKWAEMEDHLAEGDEVALMPPVSGG